MEDFTTYTEVDAGSTVSVTSTKVTASAVLDSSDARVYKDMGAAHFAGDYEHLITVYCDSATVTGLANVVWAVGNTTTGEVASSGMGTDANWLRMYEETVSAASLFLAENDGGSAYTDTNTTLSLNTPYYLKCKRDEAVGTHGTLYCYIYSDSGRTTLVDTLSITLHTSKKDYRYVYAYAGWGNEDGAYSWTGYTENLDLQEASGPANLKSLDTNVKANIKSINTNLIANTKSLNTNA